MARTVRLVVVLGLDEDDARPTEEIGDDLRRRLASEAADIVVIAATDDGPPPTDPEAAAREARRSQELTTYLAAVIAAMTRRDPNIAGYLSPTCPECGHCARPDDGAHITLGDAVVVGCEGYWVINPNTIGIPRPQWQPQP
jgi:hypothetical protein